MNFCFIGLTANKCTLQTRLTLLRYSIKELRYFNGVFAVQNSLRIGRILLKCLVLFQFFGDIKVCTMNSIILYKRDKNLFFRPLKQR